MKPTRFVTAVLVLAATGAAGCSKRGEASNATTTSADAAITKPVTAPGEPAVLRQTSGGEEVKPVVFTPVTGSFADGKAAYQAKKYGEATSIFESYIERRPGNAWGYYMLGLSAWKGGDLTKSEKAFEQALSIDPHHVKSLVNMSRVFIEQKRFDEAADRLTRASEIDPQSADVYRLLGRTYGAQGKTDEAVDAYQHALELNDRDAWSMNNLGLVLLDAKRANEALPLLAKAVELRKNVPEFQNNFGMALEHTGRFKAAAAAYSAALTADPGFDKAKKNLARVEAVKSGPEEPFATDEDAKDNGQSTSSADDEKAGSK
jgi:tetratricopeptide (TPR) repeat protein